MMFMISERLVAVLRNSIQFLLSQIHMIVEIIIR